MLTVGSLFAGIGGFDLGFERAGFEIKWQVEIDPFCRAVLAKHWPQVRRYEDVRTTHVADADRQRRQQVSGRTHGDETPYEGRASSHDLESAGDGEGRGAGLRAPCAGCLPAVDVLCGGFPCQPHSLAGRRAASADERDLWPEFARLIRELRPRWVVAENVPGLLSSESGRFFGTVLGDLAACGYDAEWDCLPASAFGAPHRRDRVWLVAYPSERRQSILRKSSGSCGQPQCRREDVADTDESRSQGRLSAGVCECASEWSIGPSGASARIFTDSNGSSLGWPAESRGECHQWESEPLVGRVAHGIPARVHRLRGLGNAIVPQIAQWIAERIKEAEGLRVGSSASE